VHDQQFLRLVEQVPVFGERARIPLRVAQRVAVRLVGGDQVLRAGGGVIAIPSIDQPWEAGHGVPAFR
jgi:ribulose 1,5-bisphosphate carboxylase large subunit-like protein